MNLEVRRPVGLLGHDIFLIYCARTTHDAAARAAPPLVNRASTIESQPSVRLWNAEVCVVARR